MLSHVEHPATLKASTATAPSRTRVFVFINKAPCVKNGHTLAQILHGLAFGNERVVSIGNNCFVGGLDECENLAKCRIACRAEPFEHGHFAGDDVAAALQPALQRSGPIAFPTRADAV